MKKKATNMRLIERPKRVQLTAEESLRRMEDFPKRRAKFIAAIRNRNLQDNPCRD